jgi:hypothetical protein
MQTLIQHPLEVTRVVGLQHAGFTRQVEIPQTRNPKSQSSSAQHRVEKLAL